MRQLIALDGTPQQDATRRQRHDRGVDGGRACSGRCCGRAALALSRWAPGRCPPAAGDPDLRRRRACRASGRHSGLHGGVPGSFELRRGARLDRRGLSCRRAPDGGGGQAAAALPTRAATGRSSRPTRRRWRCSFARSSGRASRRASRWRSRSTSRPRNSAEAASTGSASRGRELDSEGLIVLLMGWLERYPIVSIEDPLAEDDLDGFTAFTRAVGDGIQVVADDSR